MYCSYGLKTIWTALLCSSSAILGAAQDDVSIEVVTVTVNRQGQVCSNAIESTPRTYTSASTIVINNSTSTSIFSTVFSYSPLSSSNIPTPSVSPPPSSSSYSETSSSSSATVATPSAVAIQSQFQCTNDLCNPTPPDPNRSCLSASDNSTMYTITCDASVQGLAAFTPSIPRALHEKRAWAETLTDCLGRCDRSEACDAVTYYFHNCIVYDSVTGWDEGAEGSLSAVKVTSCGERGGCPGWKGSSVSAIPSIPHFTYVPAPSVQVVAGGVLSP